MCKEAGRVRLSSVLALFCLSCSFCFAKRIKKVTNEKHATVEHDPQGEGKSILANFNDDMWFGLATAAPHVEKAYDGDPWITWADSGHVRAYDSEIAGPHPKDRLFFLERPEEELKWAEEAGVQVFRLGVDWGRLVPSEPKCSRVSGVCEGILNQEALAKYREIMRVIKEEKNMKVMLTLFHHSMPMWSMQQGGWLNQLTKSHFLSFAKDLATHVHDLVDYWVTFNEPHVFVLLSNCAGIWPPGPVQSPQNAMLCLSGALPFVNATQVGYTEAMGHIEHAHSDFYGWAHSKDSPLENPRIGVAHNVAFNQAFGWMQKINTMITENLFKFAFIDRIKSKLDWLGLNYYAKEVIGTTGPMLLNTEEYSESGRGIYPHGLYEVLHQFNDRYLDSGDPDVTFKSIIITENGVADSTDLIRPAYLIEHLLAVQQAKNDGIPIEGYVHWTISDNWEWADGYCPKFGLIEVDRSSDELKRTPRDSFYLYKEIVESGKVTQQQRAAAWELVRNAILDHEDHPFCRSEGADGLDMPISRKFVNVDWRFKSLSQGAHGDGCYYTPWVSSDSSALPHTTTGHCMAIADPKFDKEIPNRCPRAVKLTRERKCPGEDGGTQSMKEERGVVCEGSAKAKEENAKASGEDASAGRRCLTNHKRVNDACCCDDTGRCGFSLYRGLFGYRCPHPLQKADRSVCSA